jgi:hypothetical protein
MIVQVTLRTIEGTPSQHLMVESVLEDYGSYLRMFNDVSDGDWLLHTNRSLAQLKLELKQLIDPYEGSLIFVVRITSDYDGVMQYRALNWLERAKDRGYFDDDEKQYKWTRVEHVRKKSLISRKSKVEVVITHSKYQDLRDMALNLAKTLLPDRKKFYWVHVGGEDKYIVGDATKHFILRNTEDKALTYQELKTVARIIGIPIKEN